MSIVVVGLSHHSTPVEMRERIAFSDSSLPEALSEIKRRGIARECVILSTCNRVELYLVSHLNPEQVMDEIQGFLSDWHELDESPYAYLYKKGSPQSLEHLFKVAGGLDSMVLGETEILGQLKNAYSHSLKLKHTGRYLNKAFQKAFQTAKQIRTHTMIQRGSISVGSVAVELAEKIFSSLKGKEVLLIGAGDTGEKTARSLMSRGVERIVVSNRSPERAEKLAAEFKGYAIASNQWQDHFQSIDIVVSSTSSPGFVVTRSRLEGLMKLRKNRPLFLIDLAVPRDVEPEVDLLSNVYLYNIDDLQGMATESLESREKEIVHCEKIIEEKIESLMPDITVPISSRGSNGAFE